MSLSRLIKKSNLVVIGLNSGTSADGLDLAAVRISRKQNSYRVKYISGFAKPYSPALRKLALDTAHARMIDLDELIYIDNLLGKFHGSAAARFIGQLSKKNVKVDLIASHGQTVRHLPGKTRRLNTSVHGTLQLGSNDFISAATGKVVIGNFRQADIALGNEGAPITVAAMHKLFSSTSESRLIVNIGGMSNYFYFPASGSNYGIRAADCGPGNSLCDLLSSALFHEKFDKNGHRASGGRASERLLSLLLADKFYSGKVTSTGRETFGDKMARRIIDFGRRFNLPDEDLLATAGELTTRSIATKVWPIVRKDRQLAKLYLTGGGRHNIFFVNRLKHHLPDLKILSVDELGIDGDYVEAAAYAVMGETCLRSIVSDTRFDGLQKKSFRRPVLGKITQPPQLRKR